MVSVEDQLAAALNEAEVWTYRTTVMPPDTGRGVKERRCFKMGDVSTRFVERGDLDGSVVDLYNSVKKGTAVKLVAGTGTGKSTKVPVILSVSISCIGIVLFPTAALASTVCAYVKKSIAVGVNARCGVEYITSSAGFLGLAGPAVAYMGVNEFLAVLSGDQDLFTKFSIAYVILDESHERIPGYMVMRYLLTTDIFKKTRVVLASASSSDQNMEKRVGGVKLRTHTHEPSELSYEDPESLTGKSPMYHDNIVGRVLIFVPFVSCFRVLKAYYNKHSVDCRSLMPTAGTSGVTKLNKALFEITRAVVILATPAHQSGYTFNIDSSISCGVTGYISVDPHEFSIVKRDRVEVEFERVQRLGRAGRHMDGEAHCVNVPPANDDFELYSGAEVYVPLWLRLFSVSVSIPYLQVWFDMVKQLSIKTVRIMLTSRVHPTLLVYYLDQNGNCYNGIRPVFPMITGSLIEVKSSGVRLNQVVFDDWKMIKYFEAEELGLPVIFRAPGDLPVDWHVIAYVLYHGLSGYSTTTLVKDGKVERSVVNGSVTGRSVVSHGMAASDFFEAGSVSSARQSKLGVAKPVSVDEELFPSDSMSSAGVYVPRVRSSDVSAPTYRTQRSSPLVNVISLADELPAVTPSREKRHKRVDSGWNDERPAAIDSVRESGSKRSSREVQSVVSSAYSVSANTTVKLKKVKALKLVDQRIRPLDSQYMATFRRVRTDKGQIKTYRDMDKCGLQIAVMPREQQITYFIATIAEWNRRTSNTRQYKAAPSSLPIIGNMLNDAKNAKYKRDLETCRKYLDTFEYHKYLIALDEDVDQLGVIVDSESLRGSLISARSTMSLVSEDVAFAVSLAERCVQLYRHTGGSVGHYFVDGNVMYIVDHVFEVSEGLDTVFLFPRTDIRSMTKTFDCALSRCALSSPAESVVRFRAAENEEFVVIAAYVSTVKPQLFGPFVVCVNDFGTYHSGVLSFGMSGAPLISVIDGCVVGFHVGISGTQGTPSSVFASL